MSKLVVCIMGQNCEKFIGMCLESVKDADAIVYCDGGSTDKTFEIMKGIQMLSYEKIKTIKNKYDQEDKGMNGKQRNFYLKYLKENYKDYWALCLDADEVMEDYAILKMKNIINSNNLEPMILSPRIHHFVGDLGHEDWAHDNHFVPNRLFKITNDLKYPEVEHTVLEGVNKKGTIDVHIYHLRECLGVFETSKKFKSNMKKSNMHTENQLRQWNRDMLLGNYPRKKIHYDKIPTPIKNKFYLQ